MKTGRAVALYQRAANEILPRYLAPNCCLNGTRIAIEVLGAFGIKAVPQPVEVQIFNPVAAELVESGQKPTIEWGERGAWILDAGHRGDPEPGHWAGHLIAKVEPFFLIDSSTGQFNRPHKQIHFSPVTVFPCPAGLPERFTDAAGAVAILEASADDSYRTLRGFQRHEGNLQIAYEVVRRMKEIRHDR